MVFCDHVHVCPPLSLRVKLGEHDGLMTEFVCVHFRQPDDWILSWGGSGQIWVWGHNHRGQLGGVEGAKVKLPQPCEQLAALRPVQLIGGEQTLFAITGDGKVSWPPSPYFMVTVIMTLLYPTYSTLPYLAYLPDLT